MKDGTPEIRPAGFDDAQAIFLLIKQYPRELLPRPISDIVQNIDRFIVCESRGRIVGCAAWQILPEIGSPQRPSVEIQSVAVQRTHGRRGIGRALIQGVIEKISPLHAAQVIVLTFAPDFFKRMGFRPIAKKKLMHKIYMGCINCSKYHDPLTCPEMAMVMTP
jgi:amino-acid N-acetyltransferase